MNVPGTCAALAAAAFVFAPALPQTADAAAPVRLVESGRVLIVLGTGGRFEALAPIERQGRLLLFRREDGTLASIRWDRVADIVRRPPSAGIAVPPPRETETAPESAAGDAVRYDNDDVERAPVIASPRDGGVSELDEIARALEILEGNRPTDAQGRDEAFWRARAAAIAEQRRRAAAEAEAARRRVAALERLALDLRRGRAIPSPIGALLIEAREELEAAERRLEEADVAWDLLREEARRAGALPGWLR